MRTVVFRMLDNNTSHLSVLHSCSIRDELQALPLVGLAKLQWQDELLSLPLVGFAELQYSWNELLALHWSCKVAVAGMSC